MFRASRDAVRMEGESDTRHVWKEKALGISRGWERPGSGFHLCPHTPFATKLSEGLWRLQSNTSERTADWEKMGISFFSILLTKTHFQCFMLCYVLSSWK